LRSVFAESVSSFTSMRSGNIAIARLLENQMEVLPRRSGQTARRTPKCLKAHHKVCDKTRTAGRSSDQYLSTDASVDYALELGGRSRPTAQSRRRRSAATAARSVPSPWRSSD
jgi:hypothetical protein